MNSTQILVIGEQQATDGELVSLLERVSSATVHLSNIATAASAVAKISPEVVVVNAQMPAAVVADVKATSADTRVAIVATKVDSAGVIDAFRNGATELITDATNEHVVQALFSNLSKKSLSEDIVSRLSLILPTTSKIIAPTVSLTSEWLASVFSERQRLRIGLALDEILRNAIEHGNCGITAAEKFQLCESEQLEAEVSRLSKIAMDEGKLVGVELEITDSRFICSVQDAGDGFNWRSLNLSTPKEQRSPESIALHGRGTIYIHSIFDDVTFNESGNCITVTKNISSTE